MTATQQSSQAPATTDNSKEMNFRKIEENLKQTRMELDRERQARIDLEKRYEESRKPQQIAEDEDDYSEPYVDHRKLSKKLAVQEERVTKKVTQQTTQDIKNAIAQAKEEAKIEAFLENNPDFEETLQNHAEKLASKSPALAKSILAMPATFERQKLVYQTIKELGLHNPVAREPSIQEKIDANRRSPFYQPNAIGSPPMGQTMHSSKSIYSEEDKKEAYKKIQDLKNRMRI